MPPWLLGEGLGNHDSRSGFEERTSFGMHSRATVQELLERSTTHAYSNCLWRTHFYSLPLQGQKPPEGGIRQSSLLEILITGLPCPWCGQALHVLQKHQALPGLPQRLNRAAMVFHSLGSRVVPF